MDKDIKGLAIGLIMLCILQLLTLCGIAYDKSQYFKRFEVIEKQLGIVHTR
jgi:hypothetical protein